MLFFLSRVSENALGLFELENFLRALRLLSALLPSSAFSAKVFPQSPQSTQRMMLHKDVDDAMFHQLARVRIPSGWFELENFLPALFVLRGYFACALAPHIHPESKQTYK